MRTSYTSGEQAHSLDVRRWAPPHAGACSFTRQNEGRLEGGASASTQAGWSSPCDVAHSLHGKWRRMCSQLLSSDSALASHTRPVREHSASQDSPTAATAAVAFFRSCSRRGGSGAGGSSPSGQAPSGRSASSGLSGSTGTTVTPSHLVDARAAAAGASRRGFAVGRGGGGGWTRRQQRRHAVRRALVQACSLFRIKQQPCLGKEGGRARLLLLAGPHVVVGAVVSVEDFRRK